MSDDTRPLPAIQAGGRRALARVAEYERRGRHARPTRAKVALNWCRRLWWRGALAALAAGWAAGTFALIFQQPNEARWPVPPAADPAAGAPATPPPPGEAGPWRWPSRFTPLPGAAVLPPRTPGPRPTRAPAPPRPPQPPTPTGPPTSAPPHTPKPPAPTTSPRPRPRITIVIPLLGGRR